MTRVGCPACGTVITFETGTLCECDADLVALPRAEDVLTFKLEQSGRFDEAEDIARRRAA